MSGPMSARRRCEVIVGDATVGSWVGVKTKVVVGLVVLEASSGVGLSGTLGGFSLDGTEGRNAADPDWDTIVGSLGTVRVVESVISAFGAVSSAEG